MKSKTFVYAVSKAFDDNTVECWESSYNDGKEIPTFKKLKAFLLNRTIALESKISMAARLSPALNDARGKQGASIGDFG
ncbi:hypothetical protein HN011_011952 [Eciton burchellii]|nr:hypothetical protein HN011_011952 [Eciton burchellii]